MKVLVIPEDQELDRYIVKPVVEALRWAEPLLDELGTDSPGRGRKAAMARLSGSYRSLRDTCPELRELEARIRAWRKAAS